MIRNYVKKKKMSKSVKSTVEMVIKQFARIKNFTKTTKI